MQNFLMILSATGLFYTALSSTLYDMTVTDCNAGIVLACKEVNKWCMTIFPAMEMVFGFLVL